MSTNDPTQKRAEEAAHEIFYMEGGYGKTEGAFKDIILAALRDETAYKAKIYGMEKDHTATLFMNQVKRLHGELFTSHAEVQRLREALDKVANDRCFGRLSVVTNSAVEQALSRTPAKGDERPDDYNHVKNALRDALDANNNLRARLAQADNATVEIATKLYQVDKQRDDAQRMLDAVWEWCYISLPTGPAHFPTDRTSNARSVIESELHKRMDHHGAHVASESTLARGLEPERDGVCFVCGGDKTIESLCGCMVCPNCLGTGKLSQPNPTRLEVGPKADAAVLSQPATKGGDEVCAKHESSVNAIVTNTLANSAPSTEKRASNPSGQSDPAPEGTPETDAELHKGAERVITGEGYFVPIDFARKLERERNEALAALAFLKSIYL